MTDLPTVRKQIDSLDIKILALIEERTALADQVAAAKKEMGKAILDPSREEAVLDLLKEKTTLSSELIETIWKGLFAESRTRQGA